jgi:hypothetical protein
LSLPLLLRQAGDRAEDPAGARRQRRVAAGRGGRQPFFQLDGGRPLIQAAGHFIQLPAQVLAGQGEELARVRRPGLAQRLEQPLDHRAEQLVRLEVERRPRQARVAPVQQRGAELVQPIDRAGEQGADGLLVGHVTGQLVQVALNDGRGVLLFHAAFLGGRTVTSGDYTTAR